MRVYLKLQGLQYLRPSEMKHSLKAQQFKLPLIQQRQTHSNKPSKSTTKRTHISQNPSQPHLLDKQKNLPKISKFTDQPDKKHRQLNKSLVQPKKLHKSHAEADPSSQSDFEEKIKENKILLKKHQLKKELQKRTRSISKQINKENISQLDKLPQIKSRKTLLPKRNNKKYISFLANKNSQEWVGTIMKGTKVNRTKSNRQLPKVHLHDKLSGSDVFENIHLFLKGLQSQMLSEQKASVPQEDIYRRILQYKNKLKKIEPNSQFLKSLDQTIQKKRSTSKRKKISSQQNSNNKQNRLRYMTCSEWTKISMNRQDLKYLESSFEEQVQKINQYLNKTGDSLEQLLKNRMSIIDLIVLKKLKVNDDRE